MIRLLGFIVFFLASNAFADKSICHDLVDSQKREVCLGNCYTAKDPALRGVCNGKCYSTDNNSYQQACQGNCNKIEDTEARSACVSCGGGSQWTSLYMLGYVKNCDQDKLETQDDPLAKGMSAYRGKDENKDYAKALKFFLQAADTGTTHAYELLADMYANGQGTKQDFTESAKWHRKAANNGKHSSQFALGNFYLLGKGVKKDKQQAFTWFEKAAKGGNKSAYLILGLMYDKGTGTEKSPEKAFSWFQKSAEANNASGQYYTGVAYIRSKGITRDIDKGIDWLKKSKKNGYTKANEILLIAQKMQKLEVAKTSTTEAVEQKATIEETIATKESKTEKKESTQETPIAKRVSQKPEIKKISKQYPRRAKVFAPSSNVRRTPGRRVICSIDTVRTINIGRYENGWYATDACGKKGYIHKSQIRITP